MQSRNAAPGNAGCPFSSLSQTTHCATAQQATHFLRAVVRMSAQFQNSAGNKHDETGSVRVSKAQDTNKIALNKRQRCQDLLICLRQLSKHLSSALTDTEASHSPIEPSPSGYTLPLTPQSSSSLERNWSGVPGGVHELPVTQCLQG